MSSTPDIIFFHYPTSPYARRVIWYLTLRKIPYTQCLQPPLMPRPDIASLGIAYRRIPLCSIGRSIYCDTRLIILVLESLFPASSQHPAISATSPEHLAIQTLLEKWVIDGGVMARAAQLLPSDLPIMNDKAFLKDREQFTGRSWGKEGMEKARPEAVAEIANAFRFLENGLLGDGRQFILGTKGPTLADIEAIWPLHWVAYIPNALPPSVISSSQFPKTFAWISRFSSHIKAASKEMGNTPTIKGSEAHSRIVNSSHPRELEFDENDPAGLKKGQKVMFWPTDSGVANKTEGILVGLTSEEVVLEVQAEGGHKVRVHAPRHGFRVKGVEGAKL